MAYEEQLPSEFYEQKSTKRKAYEDRAKDIAELTLPYLIRADGASESTPLSDLNSQSFSGRCVNTLKAKMGMALMPPATSSFRLQPSSEVLMQLEMSDQEMSDMNTIISGATNVINKELEAQQIRESLFNVIAQLIVVGSCIVEKIENDGIIIHTLKNFVVDLDRRGRPLAICIRETLKRMDLPDNITPAEEKEEYELFTMVYRDAESKDKWVLKQDIEGELVGDEKSYNNVNLPYKYLGWTWMSGDYCHRPFSEDYFKDMENIDALSQLMSDGSLVAGKNIIFVNERGGRTRKRDVADSANGDIVDGSAEDVTMFQSQKGQDMRVVSDHLSTLKRELAASFLLNESATRDAERVTAEEVRFMAQELETSSLSGIYSKLSSEWSEWIIQMVINELKYDFQTLEPNIITGLDALGRSAEMQKLDGAMTRLSQLELMTWIKESELVSRILVQQGIDMTNLVKTPDEKATEEQQAQQAQAQQMAKESLAGSTGNIAQQAVKGEQEAAMQQQAAAQA